MMKLYHYIFIFLFCLLAACEKTEYPMPCSLALQPIFLKVVDQDNNPADSVQITVTNKETGEVYNLCEDYYGEGNEECERNKNMGSNGSYVIFHDVYLDQINKNGESIIVQGMRGDLSFTQEFVIGHDGCHVIKLSGPDTVQLSS